MFYLWFLVVSTITFFYLSILYKHFRKIKVIINNGSAGQTLEIYRQPAGPLPLPVIGNLHLLASKDGPMKAFTDLSSKYGDIYSLTLGTTRCVVVNSLELIREVLNQNGQFFGGRPDFIRYHKLFGGNRNNSLALCDWSLLQKRRRNVARRYCSPRDSTSHFMRMAKIGDLETEMFLEQLSEKGGKSMLSKSDIQRACANMFFQYMCSTRFEYTDQEFCDIVRLFDEIFWDINQGYVFDFLPWLAPFFKSHLDKLTNWSVGIRNFILKHIINKREQNEKPSEDDFTSALLQGLIEDKNVSQDTIMFMLEDFIGGHSAVGNVVALTLRYLAKYADVAKKIQKEGDTVAKIRERKIISSLDIEVMPYTMATIYEVLRCSSSPIVPHVATQHTVISGYGIPKGTVVFINNYGLNHDKLFWKQPHLFKPERFLEKSTNKTARKSLLKEPGQLEESEETAKAEEVLRIKKNIPYFLPFSIGKRTCVGQNLVRNYGFSLVANILRQYDISYDNNISIDIKPGSIALPVETTPLILTKRSLNN